MVASSQSQLLRMYVRMYVRMNEQIFNLLYGLICRLASKLAPLRRVYSHIALNVSQMESLSLTMIDDECCDTESKAWSITLKSSSRRPPPAAPPPPQPPLRRQPLPSRRCGLLCIRLLSLMRRGKNAAHAPPAAASKTVVERWTIGRADPHTLEGIRCPRGHFLNSVSLIGT